MLESCGSPTDSTLELLYGELLVIASLMVISEIQLVMGIRCILMKLIGGEEKGNNMAT